MGRGVGMEGVSGRGRSGLTGGLGQDITIFYLLFHLIIKY